MAAFGFDLIRTDGAARLGRMRTAHGVVETPAFMPVATQGSVKSLAPSDLIAAGAQIVLANTYHLLLRPGHELVRELGGLHRFMGWNGPILTDSGVRVRRDPSTWERNSTPSSPIRRSLARLNTWKPPESVRMGPSQPMKRCSPPSSRTSSGPGRSSRW